MYYVYVLQSSKDKSLYIGYTADLKQRLVDHNEGKSKATRLKVPFKLIYYEAFLNKFDALNREKYLKSGYGRKTLQNALSEYFKENNWKK